MAKVVLNEVEIKLCEYVSEQRYKNNRDSGVIDKKVGPQTTQSTDLNGIGGEVACAKHLNLYPDLTIFPRKGGPDLITRMGKSIDVKTTAYANGRLIALPAKIDEQTDIYILVRGSIPYYDIIGWCTKDRLFQPSNLTDLGHGPTYVIKTEQLRLFP